MSCWRSSGSTKALQMDTSLCRRIGSPKGMTTRDIPMTKPLPGFRDEALLDNPIWYSLMTDHSNLAIGPDVGSGLVRRYPPTIGPLAAFHEPTREGYSDLARM